MPWPLAVLGEVAEAVAAQVTPWKPTSCYSVQVGEAVKTSTVKLCTILLACRKCFGLRRGSRAAIGGVFRGEGGLRLH